MEQYRASVMLCGGTGCIASGSLKLKKALDEEIKRRDLDKEINVVQTGCNGFCAKGPVMIVYPDDIFYEKVKVEDLPLLVEEHFIKGRPVERLMYKEPIQEQAIPLMRDIPFFSLQVLRALRNKGLIDAEKIEEYIARDGYQAAAKALTEMTPEQIIDEMKKSGLRGRGGAGFPTGLKWEFCSKVKGDQKYILCNGDEGDPGAFMDRSVMEADPHVVLEGMIIGGRAIGANKGYIYVRAEYPLAVHRLQVAIDQAKEYGLLGDNILGTGFNLDIEIYQGAGAFVCGEETALMRSLEGKRGMPRPRPPFPAVKGLWDKPTVLNNVETYANIPQIILNGADWYRTLGTEKSSGTKVFALSGAISNIGLIEVPMGIPLRKIIFDIGGGVPKGKKFKAVQLGGPSGGCIPTHLLDTPVTYEDIAKVGAIIGSGGMVVMNDLNCMVSVAKFFLEFTAEESCGKCTPCRVGTTVMLDILTRICAGNGREGDIELLEDMSRDIIASSLCGLGQTAPNPVLSTIKYFRNEYEAHIKHKRCDSLVCKEIVSSGCQHTCPIGTEASVYTALLAHGQFDEAIQVIRKDNPLASVCGRVCHHPCESKCKAGETGKPIAVRSLKRFAADYAHKKGIDVTIPREEKKEQKVAVVGSGPAGLTAAHFLALKGYDVTIFEAKPVVGGMLRVAIPEYRLPRAALDIDVAFIAKAGVKVKTDTVLGKDITIDSLFNEGYKAIFVAIGSHKSMKLGIPGEDMEGVMPSLRFLEALHLCKELHPGKKVVVVGGGNAALDAARAAFRMEGVEKVTVLYRRTRAEMPAFKEEVHAALEEGIDIQFLTAPNEILGANGKVNGVSCIRMKLGEVDKSGRARPVPIEGSEFTVAADTLLVAIGEQPDTSCIDEASKIEVSKKSTLVADPETMATARAGVFAGGDAVTGPNTVVFAMQAGKKAAASIDRYLRGETSPVTHEVTRPSRYVEPVSLTPEEIAELERPEMPELPPEERSKNFREVELGFTEEMAVREARRCLRCELSTLDGQCAVEEMKRNKAEQSEKELKVC